MSTLWRRPLLVFTFAVMMVPAFHVAAQECDTSCDPWASSCSDPCDRCIREGIDGCIDWVSTTCGDWGGGCIEDNCTPNWVETSRVNVGTYDGRSWSGCTHHRVDEVTTVDQNQCNRNSYFWSRTYCHDYIDSSKNGCCYPSCCSGYGDNGVQLSCNGIHSC